MGWSLRSECNATRSRERTITFSADDFGLSEAVNEAVERAHVEGVLQAASLMVGAPAAVDAVQRARRHPDLRVGLHLVVIEGPAVLRPAAIPDLVDKDGRFPSNQLGLGIRYYLHPRIRRQLCAEITAQFDAFAATGLRLDHVNAHKHMHLHPTIGAMVIRIGRRFGLSRIRIPAEPPDVLAQCGCLVGRGDKLLYRWTSLLRRQARNAGLSTNDHCFGLAWSGRMTSDRVQRLLRVIPGGHSEIYFHPAVRPDPLLHRLMPGYQHEAEFAALLDPALRTAFLPR